MLNLIKLADFLVGTIIEIYLNKNKK